MGRALVIEHEPGVQELATAALEAGDIAFEVVADGPEGLDRLAGVDVVIVGAMLPSQSGMSVLRQIRERSDDVAVVMVSRSDDPTLAVVALESDVDEYCVLPVSERELSLRVQRALERRDRRRALGGSQPTAYEDGLAMDAERHTAMLDGELLDLTVKEFDLLLALASSPRRVFSRSELLEIVWGQSAEENSTDTVTEHVYRLRQKMEAAGSAHRWIQTVRGAGYRLRPPVSIDAGRATKTIGRS